VQPTYNFRTPSRSRLLRAKWAVGQPAYRSGPQKNEDRRSSKKKEGGGNPTPPPPPPPKPTPRAANSFAILELQFLVRLNLEYGISPLYYGELLRSWSVKQCCSWHPNLVRLIARINLSKVRRRTSTKLTVYRGLEGSWCHAGCKRTFAYCKEYSTTPNHKIIN